MHTSHTVLNGITSCVVSSKLGETTQKHLSFNCLESIIVMMLGNHYVEIIVWMHHPQIIMRKHFISSSICWSFSVAIPWRVLSLSANRVLRFLHQHLCWPTVSISLLSIPLCSPHLCLSLLSIANLASPSQPHSPVLCVCVS